jgi:chromosome segregation ATPase
MAETRTINLEIKDNFKKVEKDIDDLNKSLKDTAENNRDVSKTFEEVYGELKPLTARMGEAEDRLYELAAAGDTASKEYRDLLQTVGEYRKVQIQTDMAVDAASTTLGQKLGGALGGVTSGFSLAQGAFAAFGDESKEVEEALLKVQSAMAIQQGTSRNKRSNTKF